MATRRGSILATALAVASATPGTRAQVAIDIARGEQDACIYAADADDDLATSSYAALVAGDLDGDGRADLALGAPRADGVGNTRTDCGGVHVLFGPIASGSAIDLAAPPRELLVVGAEPGDMLGSVVAVADVSGDGVADLIASATESWVTTTGEGQVYVFFGPLAPGVLDVAATSPDVVIQGATWGDRLAISIASGDLTGDGQPDLVLSAWRDLGAVWVLPGPLARGTVIDVASAPGAATVIGAYARGHLGDRVAVGDVSGDGRPDLLMSEPYAVCVPVGTFVCGRVVVLFGPLSAGVRDLGATPPDVSLAGSTVGELMGGGLAVGDVDGDGEVDVLCGAPGAIGPGGRRGGAAYILRGPLAPGSRSVTAGDVTVFGGSENDQLGDPLLVADVTGEGAPDLVIGVYASDGPSDSRVDAGEVDVLFGPIAAGSTIDLATTLPDVTAFGANPGDHLGHGTLAAADLLGSGRRALVIGAHYGDGPGETRIEAGEACIVGVRTSPLCPARPPPVTQLRAVKALPDVRMGWDVSPSTATDHYNVWKVVNRDKALIPVTNQARAASDPNVRNACAAVPAVAPSCADAGAVTASPDLVFYQVRAACSDGIEGT